MSGEPIALRLADLAERRGRYDLAELLRLRHELGVLTYGEALTANTDGLAAHYGCEVADVMIYKVALYERDCEAVATDDDLERALRMIPVSIESCVEAAAMTELEIRRRNRKLPRGSNLEH